MPNLQARPVQLSTYPTSSSAQSSSWLDPDAELVAAARDGDAASFEVLVQRRQGKILRLAQSFTHNLADAEEVTQNSFLLAFRRLDSFHGDSRFSTWLARIAINQSLIALRRRRTREVSLDAPPDERGASSAFEVDDPRPTPEERLFDGETRDHVAAAVARLKPAFRDAIEVHYFQENSTEESARILRLSNEALKTRLHRARRKLREILTTPAGGAGRFCRPALGSSCLQSIGAGMVPQPSR